MENIDISIIIPTFNRLWCLPQAIESCRRSKANVEIIVVDDGSDDGTWEYLIAQNDVVAIRQTNWGQTWAQNRGFQVARGQFVRFLDSDDMLPSYANDLQLSIARKSAADVVVAGYISWDESADARKEVSWCSCDDFIAQQLGECDSSHCYAYLYRKEFIADVPHRPDFAFREDRLFILEVAAKLPHVAICKRPCLVHRQHTRGRLQAQTSTTKLVQNWQHFQLYRKVITILGEKGLLTRRRKRAAVKVLWTLAHWTAYGNMRDSRDLVKFIYELEPDFIPPERGVLGFFYRSLGFQLTETILRIRRMLLTIPRLLQVG